ncbi:MAG: M23 family metallopeptidase [Calditrichaceae bacterium]|nr:M23 family metallopeptidase [Calditrichaceae bacterium]MBN2710566.1 M23 family metallopeptidase [Calditrichaceae bacterium]RQV94108.1 MAG: M23 family metallopeptidase [Calditrichota bacterium]
MILFPAILTGLIFIFEFSENRADIYLPIDTHNRCSFEALMLTDIGRFGRWRQDRQGIPGHFHTGIDIKRPSDNDDNAVIFPMADGRVISKREDGPYAQLIIEHIFLDETVWTVYEHIAGIKISVGDSVYYNQPVARFMNREELDRFGWQFDHLHFEILKTKPQKLKIDSALPERRYNSYTLICYSKEKLHKYYYDPIEYFEKNWK